MTKKNHLVGFDNTPQGEGDPPSYAEATQLFGDAKVPHEGGKNSHGILERIWNTITLKPGNRSRGSPSTPPPDLPPPNPEYCISSLHCDPRFMDPVRQKESPWTASLRLIWFMDGCAVYRPNPSQFRPEISCGRVNGTFDGTFYPKIIPPWWRLTENLDKCVGDGITTDRCIDPLYPSRSVYTRTISFDYYKASSRLKIRTPGRSSSPVAARVELCVSSGDLNWLRKLDKGDMISLDNFFNPKTAVV
jgi:hypothetical protein